MAHSLLAGFTQNGAWAPILKEVFSATILCGSYDKEAARAKRKPGYKAALALLSASAQSDIDRIRVRRPRNQGIVAEAQGHLSDGCKADCALPKMIYDRVMVTMAQALLLLTRP